MRPMTGQEKTMDKHTAGYFVGRLSELVYAVQTGSKPVGQILVHGNYVKLARKYLKGEDILYLEFPLAGHNQTEVFIFKYPHLESIINFVQSGKLNNLDPKTKHWIQGKLFGYSESAINQFISGNKRKML